MLGRNTYLHHPRPTTTVDSLDGVEILLHHHQYLHHHHHHHQLEAFPGLYLAANAPTPLDSSTPGLFNQDNGEPSSKPVKKQTAAKKDRHSKIHTAQGPRDRRVRLSIGIARKFFDLQEMLGFDKPSKTLDWLLTKSKAAIKELVQKKQSSNSSPSSPTSACDLISSPAAGDMENSGADSKRKFKVGKEAAVSLAKESRAKARARARERTLEKMCIKQLGGGERCNASDLINPSFECRNNKLFHNHQLEFLQLSAAAANSSSSNNDLKGSNNGGFHFPLSNDQDLIEEESSAIIKRKNKNVNNNNNNNTCSLLGFQQNHLVFSTDLNSNYMNQIPSANNAAAHESWDNVFGLNSQSNLHGVLDHHKFFNI